MTDRLWRINWRTWGFIAFAFLSWLTMLFAAGCAATGLDTRVEPGFALTNNHPGSAARFDGEVWAMASPAPTFPEITSASGDGAESAGGSPKDSLVFGRDFAQLMSSLTSLQANGITVEYSEDATRIAIEAIGGDREALIQAQVSMAEFLVGLHAQLGEQDRAKFEAAVQGWVQTVELAAPALDLLKPLLGGAP